MSVNYVKFFRGTPLAFQNLKDKDNDTLYFISDVDSKTGSLYLGEKLISESISSIKDLFDIDLNDSIQDNDLLSYDINSEKWINKPVIEAIGLMTGATYDSQGGAGLVPAPGIGQNHLFLRGDGVWATPVGGGTNVGINADERTIIFEEDGVTIGLKDFGVKYYKYVAKTEDAEAHYEAQIVDATNPWKENLEARVTIDGNGQFVLGWFEKDLSDLEAINALNEKIEIINTSVSDLASLLNNTYTRAEVDALVQDNRVQIDKVNSSVTSLASLLNYKADAASVYTKSEIDAKLLQVDHLVRKTFKTLEEANSFAESETNPEGYIYMVASGSDASTNDKYAEYLYIEGALELIGSWDVNLDNYASKQDLQTVTNQITNLESVLNNKAEKSEVAVLSNAFGAINTRVENLEEFLNSDYFAIIDEMQVDLSDVKDAVTWKEL